MPKKNTIAILCLAALATLPASAGKKHKWTTVNAPASAYSFREALVPKSVEYCDTCTRITFDISAEIPNWNIAASARLIAGGQVFPVRRGRAVQTPLPHEGQPIDTTPHEVPFVFGHNYSTLLALRYGEVNEDLTSSFIMEFPPLPKGTTVFDFDEGITDNPQQFRVTGIRLDGQNYPALLQHPEGPTFTWTASTTAEARDARVRVNIIGENLPDNLPDTPYFYAIDRNNPLMSSLTEPKWEPYSPQSGGPRGAGTHGGVATLRFAVPTPYLLYFANTRMDVYPVLFVPGEESVLTIDYTLLHNITQGKAEASDDYFSLVSQAGAPINFDPDDELLKSVTNPEVAQLRFQERIDATALLERCGKLEEVAEAEVAAVAAPYRDIVTTKWKESCALRAKMAEGKGGKICEVPNVAPAEMIKSIVAQYKGKAVYVDLWATWCGPCKQGIKAMIPHHDDFSHDDVEFVYITDESSPADQWNAMVVSMPGQHYRLKTMNGLEPAISGIPRYLIFDREGNLSFDQAGFGPGMDQKLCDEIRKAMGE